MVELYRPRISQILGEARHENRSVDFERSSDLEDVHEARVHLTPLQVPDLRPMEPRKHTWFWAIPNCSRSVQRSIGPLCGLPSAP